MADKAGPEVLGHGHVQKLLHPRATAPVSVSKRGRPRGALQNRRGRQEGRGSKTCESVK